MRRRELRKTKLSVTSDCERYGLLRFERSLKVPCEKAAIAGWFCAASRMSERVKSALARSSGCERR
jgi:predicted ferric reductase